MKGKVSFDREEDELGDDYSLTPLTLKKSTVPNPIFRKPTQRASRGVRNTLNDNPGGAEERPYIFDIKDLSLEMDDTFNQEYSTIPTEQAEEADYEEMESGMRRKIEEARRLRLAKQSEALLDDYVSLESTTQKHLDSADMAFIMRSSSVGHQCMPASTWEDPDEEELSRSRTRLLSESEESETLVDDGLDEEPFEAYKDLTGRIGMKVVEDGHAFDDKDVNLKDFQDDQEDEEGRRWELQQLSKGFSSAGRGIKSVPREARKVSRVLQRKLKDNTSLEDRQPLKPAAISSILSEVTQLSSQLCQSIDETRTSLSVLELKREELSGSIERHGEIMASAGADADFYQAMNGLIVEFADMVDALLPLVESLGEEWLECLKTRRVDGNVYVEPASFQSRRQLIFAEASEDFSNPERLLQRLAEWKQHSPQSYEGCFIDLCLPSLLEIFCHAALIGFDPMSRENSVEEQILSKLSLSILSDDASMKTRILTTAITPRIIALIQAGYETGNEEHRKNLSNLRGELEKSLPDGSRLLAVFDCKIN